MPCSDWRHTASLSSQPWVPHLPYIPELATRSYVTNYSVEVMYYSYRRDSADLVGIHCKVGLP
jgi:hypothetical protein